MLYIEDDGWGLATVRDDESSDSFFVSPGEHEKRDWWLNSARKTLTYVQHGHPATDGDDRIRMAESALFHRGLYTPDCGDSLTVPMGAQVWLRFFCNLAEDAQDVLEERLWDFTRAAK